MKNPSELPTMTALEAALDKARTDLRWAEFDQSMVAQNPDSAYWEDDAARLKVEKAEALVMDLSQRLTDLRIHQALESRYEPLRDGREDLGPSYGQALQAQWEGCVSGSRGPVEPEEDGIPF